MMIKKHSTSTIDLKNLSPSERRNIKRKARRKLEQICPSLIKPTRLRNIVRRAVRKSKTKEFTNKLDALLLIVGNIHDLTDQEDAMNPQLLKSQRDGSIARAIKVEFGMLLKAYEEIIALV